MATDGDADGTVQLPTGEVPEIAPLARVAARAISRSPVVADDATIVDPPASLDGNTSLDGATTAVAALRHEEVERTRLFIRMGWVLSVAVMATIPFVEAPPAMSAALCAGLVIGMIVSYGYHRAFADPARYTERALISLAAICTVNGLLGVMYYGAFTAAPLMVVVGIHFVARTEAERVARWIVWIASIGYAGVAAVIISGAVPDPGVFASDREIDRGSLVIGTVFVLGTYVFAYLTARMFRLVSLAAIEELAAATRLASQREALMNELRADLERALKIGGPGRYTDELAGKLKLGVVIGRGAIGEVYEAVHVDTGELAAVKVLRRELLVDPVQVERFLREARASAAIASPHVVRVIDVASTERASGGEGSLQVPFLATERLAGHTLAELLRREPRLSPEATLAMCRQVGVAIDAATRAGIVHRDLKPQNLMCDDAEVSPTWKVLDFGVAAFAHGDDGALTRGEAIGTPHFMAPEQAQGRPVDHRTDLHALGAIVYRCLTGRRVFEATDTPSLLYAVVHRMPVQPTALVELPRDVDRWCALAIAKSPADRFESGEALANALADALAGKLDPALAARADALVRKHGWEPE